MPFRSSLSLGLAWLATSLGLLALKLASHFADLSRQTTQYCSSYLGEQIASGALTLNRSSTTFGSGSICWNQLTFALRQRRLIACSAALSSALCEERIV